MRTPSILYVISWVAGATCIALPKSTTSTSRLPPTCGNAGVQWAAYYDSQGGISNDNFNPTYIQTKTPELGPGIIHTVGAFSTTKEVQFVYHSSKKIDVGFMTLNIIAYFYAPQTGTYTFTSPYANDILYVWVGPNAYNGWTAGNANAYIGNFGSATFTYDMTAGQYYPMRIIFVNTYGGGGYTLQITQPDGTSADRPHQFVQFSCDGTTAPAFPDY